MTAYKRAAVCPRRWPWRQAGLKPYWGKPAVRNFRGGRGNEVDGLMTVCHKAQKGRYVGSHWPNHVRASALLDVFAVKLDSHEQRQVLVFAVLCVLLLKWLRFHRFPWSPSPVIIFWL